MKNVGTALLILFLIASGLPHYFPEDASRDGMVDLKDAILLARDLSAAAEKPADFSAAFRNVLTAVRMVAGLAPSITPESQDKSSAPKTLVFIITDQLCSSSHFDFSLRPTATISLQDPVELYRSIQHPPAVPPPRLPQAC